MCQALDDTGGKTQRSQTGHSGWLMAQHVCWHQNSFFLAQWISGLEPLMGIHHSETKNPLHLTGICHHPKYISSLSLDLPVLYLKGEAIALRFLYQAESCPQRSETGHEDPCWSSCFSPLILGRFELAFSSLSFPEFYATVSVTQFMGFALWDIRTPLLVTWHLCKGHVIKFF